MHLTLCFFFIFYSYILDSSYMQETEHSIPLFHSGVFCNHIVVNREYFHIFLLVLLLLHWHLDSIRNNQRYLLATHFEYP